VRPKPYRDQVGKPNLDDVGTPSRRAEALLDHDIARATSAAVERDSVDETHRGGGPRGVDHDLESSAEAPPR